jgi:hypothetical protein
MSYKYRELVRKSDPVLRIKLPQELYDDLCTHSERNARTLARELIARLCITLENNDELMVQDRLKRLIFCRALAYKEKSNKVEKGAL